MNTSSPPIIQSRPVQPPHTQLNCPLCLRAFEYPTPPASSSASPSLHIRCCHCNKVIQHNPGYGSNKPNTSTSNTNGSAGGVKKGGRRIGTQEKPLETGYYDLLGVPVNATEDDIKKAYRRLAIKHHPDKNRDDPHAEEKFKEIAIAYQTLSDPTLRKKYNEYGPKESAPEGGFVDPEEVFGAIFGGERFLPIVGELSLAKDMKSALQEADEEEEEAAVEQKAGNGIEGSSVAGPGGGGAGGKKDPRLMSPEERAKKAEKDRIKAEKARVRAAEKAAARAERVAKLVTELERKLSIYTESATGVPGQDKDVTHSWRTICQIEAEELKKESYGVELLHSVGFVYTSKAKHYMATKGSLFGVGGWLHNVQGKYHVFSETVSTVRAAIELKAVFDQIAAAEKNGALPPEERKKLEDAAAEKGLQTLFKGAKLEIESVLREVCDRVLGDDVAVQVGDKKVLLRAMGLQILGEAYLGVKKDGNNGGGGGGEGMEEGYVRVDRKS